LAGLALRRRLCELPGLRRTLQPEPGRFPARVQRRDRLCPGAGLLVRRRHRRRLRLRAVLRYRDGLQDVGGELRYLTMRRRRPWTLCEERVSRKDPRREEAPCPLQGSLATIRVPAAAARNSSTAATESLSRPDFRTRAQSL